MKNHERILEALQSAPAPLSAYDLLDAVRAHGISAPLTVYRALDRLILEGRVHRLDSIKAYVACTHPGRHEGTTVFAICRDCGSAAELAEPGAMATLREEGHRHGFAADEASVELKGVCANCRTKPDA